MEMDLKNIQWGEFEIGEEFFVKNSKAYHKTDLKETKNNGISYISRTNLNNGLESIVKNDNFKLNKKNTIVFGAENATFFYQPNEYITGNKMYYIESDKLNKYSSLFIQMMLNKSIVSCGFGYGKGLIGSRVQKRFVQLPINSKGEPDYVFMEQFMRQKEQEKITKFQNYIAKRIEQVKDYKEVKPLNQIEWGEFFIEDLFNTKIGKSIDGNKINKASGKIAYITRKESNNGLDGFIKNDINFLNKDFPVITIGNETAEPFVQLYPFFTGTKVNILNPKNKVSRYSLTFISECLKKHKVKYSYSFTINSTRLKRQKILLPTDKNGQPDYDYMENYIKKLEYEKLTKYITRKTTNA